MSQFLEQIRERFKARKQANQAHQIKDAFVAISATPNTPRSILARFTNKTISPTDFANTITLGLILLSITCAAYWILRIAQLPTTPPSGTNPSKGVMLYSNQDQTSAYALFGSKPLITDNIFLRGVVITSAANSKRLEGFAIFEIDGKQTPAIGIGENLGKGLTLQSLGPESATLLYEGQKLDFKLTKSGTGSTNSTATSAKK